MQIAGVQRSKLNQVASWMVIMALTITFLTYYRSFLQPFIVAVALWLLIKALRTWIGHFRIRGKHLPNWLRGTLAFILTLSLLAIVVEIVALNIELIARKIPEYGATFDRFLDGLARITGIEDIVDRIRARLVTLNVQSYLSGIVASFTSFLGNFVLIVIYITFLLIEEAIFSRKLQLIIPNDQKRRNTVLLLQQINRSINRYLSIKTGISLLTGFLSFFMLWALQVDFPVFWAFLIFLFNYIPYIGSMVATLLPAIFSIFQFGSFWPFLYVFLGVEAIQVLVGNYIEPRVMGKSLNLSPLVVVMALSFWGSIWGVLGMILSVPITSIMAIIMARFPETRRIAIIMSENAEIEGNALPDKKQQSSEAENEESVGELSKAN